MRQQVEVAVRRRQVWIGLGGRWRLVSIRCSPVAAS
jgi:hypothetical protein